MTYDRRGLISRRISANGLETTYTYNTQGLMASQTQIPPMGSPGHVRVTQYRYHPTGLIKQVITPDGITLNYVYDVRNNLLSITDNLGQTINYEYDAHKNLIQTETSNSNGSLALTISHVYDHRNRLITTQAPHNDTANAVSERLLDNNSNLISITDPKGNDSSNQYDPFNRLSQNTHRLNGVTRYDYDLLDRITKVTAPNGVVTEYQNDLIGRRIKEISQDRGTLSYQYDLANNLTSMTDGRGITSTYLYDALERPISKTYPNTIAGKVENVSYHYDSCAFGVGRLCTLTDESGSYDYQYDAYGNLTQMVFTESSGTLYRTEYRYDDGDNIMQITYPSGRIIAYSRDQVRRIAAIDSHFNGTRQTILNNIHYRGDNQMTQCHYGNGLLDNRIYDLQGRLIQQQLSNANHIIIDQRDYAYDLNGNIIQRNTTPQNRQYQYDALDRIVQESTINNSLPISHYDYDLNDNRLRVTTDNTIHSYIYKDKSNRLDYIDSIDNSNASQPPLTDTQQTSRELVYNDAGRLYQILIEGEIKGEYVYNDQGQRTKKTAYVSNDIGITTSTTTIYHYDQQGMLMSETTVDGELIRDYVQANGRAVAQIEYDAGSGIGAGIESVHYLMSDHLFTARLATDQSQKITWRWDGEAFGAGLPVETGVVVNLRFPGQYFDVESGLVYNWNRYYDPDTGRYISSDPIGLDGGINTYGYVSGNPVNLSDFQGLKKKGVSPLDILRKLAEEGAISKITEQIEDSVQQRRDTQEQTAKQEIELQRKNIEHAWDILLGCDLICMNKRDTITCFDYGACRDDCWKDYDKSWKHAISMIEYWQDYL